MKARLQYCLHWLGEGIRMVLRRYPVELLLALFACVGCIVSYEMDDDFLMPRVSLAALFLVVALVVNNLAGQGPWRKLYWVCWLPLLPLSMLDGLEAWRGTPSFFITYLVLSPLAVLLCRRAVNNDRFVNDAVVWLRSGVLAVLFANVALGLFCAILFSTAYIFGVEGAWTRHVGFYAVIVCETLVAPLLLLMMSDRWRGATWSGSRVVDLLLNYIVTPALLIYTAILGLYMLKIIVVWELPRGGVAYLVFGFTLLALGVKALQSLLQKRMYDWFFDRFSLVALPAQVLFWVGTLQRTGEYGLTESRVYLLVCGALMTLCVLLFLGSRTGRYLYVALAVFLSFAALAWIPGLEPQRLAVGSQLHRAVRIAGQLDLLSDNGTLNRQKLSQVDTTCWVDLNKLYESLRYLDRHDSTAFAQFGMTAMSDFRTDLPAAIRDQVIEGMPSDQILVDDSEYISLVAPVGGFATPVGTYSMLYTSFGYNSDDATVGSDFDNDTLRIRFGAMRPTFVIAGRELLATQLQQIGVADAAPATEFLEDHAAELLRYTADDMTIIFSRIALLRSDSTLTLRHVDVDAVLVK